MRLLVCLLLAMGCMTAGAAYAEPGQKIVQDLVMLFSAWSDEDADKDIYEEAAKYIDYAGMSERALGKDNWKTISAAQRQEFVTAFRKLVEQRYYKRWHKLFFNGRLTYIGQTSAGEDTLVKTALLVGKEEDMVIWRLHPRGNDLAVISLAVDEEDLLSKLHERFQKRLQKRGFADLLAWMKDKLDDENGPPPKPGSSAALR